MSLRISLCMLLLLCAGCRTRLQQHELFGKYEAFVPNGTIQVTLSKDMTYEETITLKDGTVKRLNGKWTYDSNKGYLDLPKMFDLDDNDNLINEIVGAAIPVTKYLATICLEADANRGLCYNKIKTD